MHRRAVVRLGRLADGLRQRRVGVHGHGHVARRRRHLQRQHRLADHLPRTHAHEAEIDTALAAKETELLMEFLVRDWKGPAYIRLSRQNLPDLFPQGAAFKRIVPEPSLFNPPFWIGT